MQIGLGLPGTIPDVPGKLMLEWARKADAGPFSSLDTIDRLAYPNYEPLVTLAAAAAVTQRIRLITGVLIAPLRNAGMLAKQVASIDALSEGRLTLGLGIGARQDDYKGAPADFHRRGKILDEQLAIMKRAWSGQPLNDEVGPIGPAPVSKGGPEILIGGYAPEAVKRVARWGAGYISGAGGLERALQGYKLAEQAWREAGRPGKPRFVGAFYFGLGPNAHEQVETYLRHYYAFMGPMVERVVSAIITTPEALKEAIQTFENSGMDELILVPGIADLAQIDRVREVIG